MVSTLPAIGPTVCNHVLSRIAVAAQIAARISASLAAHVAAVILAPLQQDEVAGFDLGKGTVPVALVHIAAAAASRDGPVGHVDPGQVEVVRQVRSPAQVRAVAGG